MKTITKTPLELFTKELEGAGMQCLTLKAFKCKIKEAGFDIPAHLTCKSMAKVMTGPLQGLSFPNVALHPTRKGVSFANAECGNVPALLNVRNNFFAVHKGMFYHF